MNYQQMVQGELVFLMWGISEYPFPTQQISSSINYLKVRIKTFREKILKKNHKLYDFEEKENCLNDTQ